MYIDLHVKYVSFLSDFNKCWILWADFWKLIQTSFIETNPETVDLFHADKQTDESRDRHKDVKNSFPNSLQNLNVKWIL